MDIYLCFFFVCVFCFFRSYVWLFFTLVRRSCEGFLYIGWNTLFCLHTSPLLRHPSQCRVRTPREESRTPPNAHCVKLSILAHIYNSYNADAWHYCCLHLQRVHHGHTKWRALCYPQAVCGFVSSMVITLFYAHRSLPATHHPSDISPPRSTRASLPPPPQPPHPGPLSNDILKLLSSPNSQRHPSFIRHPEWAQIPLSPNPCTTPPQLQRHKKFTINK